MNYKGISELEQLSFERMTLWQKQCLNNMNDDFAKQEYYKSVGEHNAYQNMQLIMLKKQSELTKGLLNEAVKGLLQ